MTTDPLDTEAQARALPEVQAVHALAEGFKPGWREERGKALLGILYTPLREAGVTPGAFEAGILDWLTGFEPEMCAAVANLMERIREAAFDAGRTPRIVKHVDLPPEIPGQARVVLVCSCGAANDVTYEIILAPAVFTCHGCGTEYTWPPEDRSEEEGRHGPR